MKIVPLQAVANQTLTIQLDNQNTQLNIRQTDFGMFMDVLVNNNSIIMGVLCQNMNRIVRDLYLGFSGDLLFFDNQGDTDPYYTGLGDRYVLLYVSSDELPAGVG
jgi:hypothetical protein